MKYSKTFSLRLPLDLHQWIDQSYFKRGCASKTDYVLQLIAKGIQAEAIDDTVSRIKEAGESGPAREMLRQTLAVRYMLETQAKDSGAVRLAEKFGSDALVWADKEMSRLFPDRSES